MTKSAKTFIALILTYSLKKAGLYLINFDPLNYFAAPGGFIVDLSLWILLFYAIFWSIDALVKTKVGE